MLLFNGTNIIIMSNKTNHIQSSNEYFHIYNRGVNRGTVFFSENNYSFFLARMGKYLDKNKVKVVAFCLMPNHFHMILQQIEVSGISQYLKSVCNSYVKAVNKEQNRSGHLLEGKYKIKKITDDEYLLHLSRYIHLNPVRAGLAGNALLWKFSSYSEYVNHSRFPFVSPEVVLSQFKDVSEYQEFVDNYQPAEKLKISDFLF